MKERCSYIRWIGSARPIKTGKSPEKKIYLADPGLLTVLGQVSSGQYFENAIAVQLARMGQVSYYQRRTGQEIDFIRDQTRAIEVKETPTPHDLTVLNSRAASIGLSQRWLVGRKAPGMVFKEWYRGGNLVVG